MQNLEQRLVAAEREGRRWRRVFCALGMSAVAISFIAANKQVIVPELVIARKFVAVNERGEPVAILGHVKNVGLLGVSGSDGNLMFVATATDDSRGVVTIHNRLGRQLVKIGSDKSGHGLVSTSHRQRGVPVAGKSAEGVPHSGG